MKNVIFHAVTFCSLTAYLKSKKETCLKQTDVEWVKFSNAFAKIEKQLNLRKLSFQEHFMSKKSHAAFLR